MNIYYLHKGTSDDIMVCKLDEQYSPVGSSFIGSSIHSALCHIEVKSFVNFRHIDRVGRVLANGPGDLGSILDRIIPNTLKIVLDTSLLNTQQYKVRIKGKVEQYRERSSALPYTSV